VARKTTVLRFNNFTPVDLRGVRLIFDLSLSRATTVLRKKSIHAKPRNKVDT
jgi:hypothetical protein